MPRLTYQRYLEIHHQLATMWFSDPRDFGYVDPDQQRLLHDFFVPSKHLTDVELLEHRRQISTERPSLPQGAGRALRKLEHGIEMERSRVLVASGGSGGPHGLGRSSFVR